MSQAMDDKTRKALFADLDRALAERQAGQSPEAVQALAAQHRALAAKIETLTTDKQVCSGQFGAARRAGEDLAPLKARMQAISSALSALGAELKDVEDQLLPLLAPKFEPVPGTAPDKAGSNTQPGPPFPARFTQEPLPSGQPPARIIEASTLDAARWDAYVSSNPRASLYHFSTWRRMIEDRVGHRDISLAALDASGAVLGVLPLTLMDSRLFGRFAVSVPYFNYGGVLADSDAVAQALLAHAAQQGEALGVAHVELRHTAQVCDWPARDNKVSMIRRLPDTPEALDQELGSKIRAQIKRAEREGLTVQRGGAALLDDFYRVFAENMRDLGTPVYSKGFFRAVLAAWPARSHIVVVYLKGRPVACAFLMGHGDLLEIPWASTLRRVNALGVNMYLYWEVLSLAIAEGYGYFDFGRSTEDAGTYRFKKQWGAQPVRHHWHYWLPAGQALPQLNPDNPKYRLMIAVWQRLPVFVTRLIGPPVVRNLP